jgi:hypothetical protein
VLALAGIPELLAAELIEGIAYRLPERTEVYRELHRRVDFDHLVEYRSPAGDRFADLALDYRCSATAPSHEQRDERTGKTIGARWESGTYLLWRGDERRSVPAGPELVASSGFDRFIARNWSALHGGETLVLEFALPAHLRTLRMRVSRTNTGDDTGVLHLRVEPAQSLLRRFVAPIELVYDSQRRLQVFRGRSNLTDEDGAPLDVEIHYRHSSASTTLQAMTGEPAALAARNRDHEHCRSAET